MGLSGMPFVGDDIGGYIGNTSKELFSRWMQVGMFAPYARNHKEAFANANEPWSYGEEAEAISKEFVGFRYRLLPYLYSKFYEASQTGMPIMRSLCIENPFDDKVYDNLFQYQFLCGDAILVIPVTSQEKSKKIYLPQGAWYNIYTDEQLTGNQVLTMECPVYQIPVFIKASSVIPMQSLTQTTKQRPSDTLFVHIYFGTEKNIFEYYEDDGNSMEYQNGAYYRRNIEYDPVSEEIRFSKPQGTYTSTFTSIQCIFHDFPFNLQNVKANGQSPATAILSDKILDGLRYLEDIYDPAYFRTLRKSEKNPDLKTVTFKNANEAIVVNLK
jgi:alpha-glucosidase